MRRSLNHLSLIVPCQTVENPSQVVQPNQTSLRVMATRFSPLSLPAQLHDLPQNYAQRINHMMLKKMLQPENT
jgi:hypothetical protein